MKRSMTLVFMSVILALVIARAPVYSNPLVSERGGTWTEHGENVAAEPWSFSVLQEDCKKVALRLKSTVETCVRTVATVVKVLARAVQTVVVSVGKLVLRLAFSLLIIFGQWVFGLLV